MFEQGPIRNLWQKLSRNPSATPAQDPPQAPPAQESANEYRKKLMIEVIVGDSPHEEIQRQGGLSDQEIDVVAGLSKQERRRRMSVGFCDQTDPDTLNAPDLSGQGWEFFELRSRGPYEQDPGNQENYRHGRMFNRDELQTRIVVVKGLDANCTPGEILDLFKRGGVVTALTIIKGIIENY